MRSMRRKAALCFSNIADGLTIMDLDGETTSTSEDEAPNTGGAGSSTGPAPNPKKKG